MFVPETHPIENETHGVNFIIIFGFHLSFRGLEHVTPLKINMEHNSEGLEDDFPFE